MAKSDPSATKQKPSKKLDTLARPQGPAFMRDAAGMGTEDFTPEDVAWAGETYLVGEADRERDKRFDEIAKEVFNSRHALRLILYEIIRRHPVNERGRTDKARLGAALTALLGDRSAEAGAKARADKKRSGPNKETDDDLLRVIAREYLVDAYGFSGKRRSFSKLCDEAISEIMPKSRTLTSPERDTIRRRLNHKFGPGAIRDRVMIEYTAAEGEQFFHLVRKALLYLSALGLADSDRIPDITMAVKSRDKPSDL